MDGLGRAVGAGVTLKFGEREIILEPLTLRDFGLIEQHLLSQRRSPLDLVKDVVRDLPPELAKSLLEQAYEDAKKGNTISPQEIAEWIDTFDGMAYSLWLSLEKRYPGEYQLTDVHDVMQQMMESDESVMERLKALRDQASGLDERGNSTGGTSS